MNRRYPLAAFSLTAAALLALAGCAAPTSSSDDPGSEGPSGGGGSLGECLIGTWSADIADVGQQLLDFFVDSGAPVTEVDSSGTLTLEVDDTSMTYTSDLTHEMRADVGDLELVIVQSQTGVSSGGYAVDGDTVEFSDWTEGITIESAVTLGGVDSDVPFDVPGGPIEDVPTTVTCDGDVLTTFPEGGLFVYSWARVD